MFTPSPKDEFDRACTAVSIIESTELLTSTLRRVQRDVLASARMRHREVSGLGGGWLLSDMYSTRSSIVETVAAIVDRADTPKAEDVARFQLRHRCPSESLDAIAANMHATMQVWDDVNRAIDVQCIVANMMLASSTSDSFPNEVEVPKAVEFSLSYLGFLAPHPSMPGPESSERVDAIGMRSISPADMQTFRRTCLMLHHGIGGAEGRPRLNVAATRHVLSRRVDADSARFIAELEAARPMHNVEQRLHMLADGGGAKAAHAARVLDNLHECMSYVVHAHVLDLADPASVLVQRLRDVRFASSRVRSVERSGSRKRSRGSRLPPAPPDASAPDEDEEGAPTLNTLVVCNTHTSHTLRTHDAFRRRGLLVRSLVGHPDTSTCMQADVLCVTRQSMPFLRAYKFKRVLFWDGLVGPPTMSSDHVLWETRMPQSAVRWIVRENAILPWMSYPMPVSDAYLVGFERGVPHLTQTPGCVFVV